MILAAFGVLTAVLHFTAIPLRGFIGYSLATPMGVPMGLSHLALALWMMARGFQELSLATHFSKAQDFDEVP